MRAGVFPRWAGLLLIVGDVVFGLGSFAGSAATIFEIVGALITCVALVWLGLSLLSGNAASAAGQPTRVSSDSKVGCARDGADKGCQPGPSVPLGTVRPGCLGLLGLPGRKHNDREDRLGGGCPARGRGRVGHVRIS